MHSSIFYSPRHLREKLPLSLRGGDFITKSRKEVHNILTQQDPRLLLIVGPCSIHELKSAQDYARRLKTLSDETKNTFLIVMRSYMEKPRTALGWKGLVHDPYLDGSHQMERGYEIAREFLLFLAELNLPAACEFLDPPSCVYNGDMITWGCIGARTSSSQVHRQLASDLPMPVAFKNSTDGNIESAVNGCLAAVYPHTFLGLNEDGILALHHSKGNPDAHVVLRGGEGKPNYDQESIQTTLQMLRRHGLPERVVIDCSHDNCDKQYAQQQIVFEEILEQVVHGSSAIRGLMLESFLKEGNQPLNAALQQLSFGVSVTDPCLGWETTEKLIRAAHQEMQCYIGS